MLRRALILIAVVVTAVTIGWLVARPQRDQSVTTNPAAPTPARPQAADATGKKPTAKAGAWVPPEGNPVTRYQEAKTKQERYDVISNFMALGHEKNPFMLVEALKDPDVSNRVYAVESASALTTEEATHVLRYAVLNDTWDVREMAWSLLAPYPVESKASVFAEVIANGPDASLSEAFDEMGRNPDIQLFDTMVAVTPKTKPERQSQMLKVIPTWLEPGGGEVPQFKSLQEVTTWWLANRKNYDEFMLRIDQ